MRIQSVGKVLVLAKNERDGQNRQKYFNLAVLIGGEAGNLSCTEEAYETAVEHLENEVTYEYNDQYKSFRIISAQPEKPPYAGNMYGTPQDSPASAPEPDAKADNEQPDAKPDNKPDSKQPDAKTDSKPETKADNKSDKSAK